MLRSLIWPSGPSFCVCQSPLIIVSQNFTDHTTLNCYKVGNMNSMVDCHKDA